MAQVSSFKSHDVTLRDGNHALKHQLTADQAVRYAQDAFSCGISSIEIGHGNGLGGSSSLVGRSREKDSTLISAVREAVPEAELVVHSMPSFATISRDLGPAIALGVDKFRIGAHCTEVNTTERHLKYLIQENVSSALALMMVTHISQDDLYRQVELGVSFGVREIVLMDSVGRLIPADVSKIVSGLLGRFDLDLTFHAHDNLGLAMANSLTAISSGATCLDASILGMGAGAGNTALELLVAASNLDGVEILFETARILRLARYAEDSLGFVRPRRTEIEVATAVANLFSGYAPVIKDAASRFGIDPIEITYACLGKKLVAGQEDQVYRAAEELSIKND